MYQPTKEDFERYRDQFDDPNPMQYAYHYGMHIYEIADRYDLVDEDLADAVIYWFKRYIDQDETEPDCLKKAKYIVAKLFHEFPELREVYRKEE